MARFIELAGKVNKAMPDYVISRCKEALKAYGKTINGSRILILGLAYKPNVDDDRESPGYVIMQNLESQHAIVEYHDPHIPIVRSSREHSCFAGKMSVEFSGKTIQDYDLVIIATAHDSIDYSILEESKCPVVDTRGVIDRPWSGYMRA